MMTTIYVPTNETFAAMLENNYGVLQSLLNAARLPRYASTRDAIEVLKKRLCSDYADSVRKGDFRQCAGKLYTPTSLRLRESAMEPVWLVLSKDVSGRWLLNYSRQNNIPDGFAPKIPAPASSVTPAVPRVRSMQTTAVHTPSVVHASSAVTRTPANTLASALAKCGWTVENELAPQRLEQLFPLSEQIAMMTTFRAGSDLLHALRLAATYPADPQVLDVSGVSAADLQKLDLLLRTLSQKRYIRLFPAATWSRRFQVAPDPSVQDYLKGKWAEIYVASQLLELVGHNSSWQIRMDVQVRSASARAEADLLFYNRNTSQLYYIECKSGRAYRANHDTSELLNKAARFGVTASHFAVFSSETNTLAAGMEHLCTSLTTFNVKTLRKGLEKMIRMG